MHLNKEKNRQQDRQQQVFLKISSILEIDTYPNMLAKLVTQLYGSHFHSVRTECPESSSNWRCSKHEFLQGWVGFDIQQKPHLQAEMH